MLERAEALMVLLYFVGFGELYEKKHEVTQANLRRDLHG